jgi:hypothetical protein
MFESIYPMVLTDAAMHSPHRDLSYRQFFSGVPRSFVGSAAGAAAAGAAAAETRKLKGIENETTDK